MRSPSSNTIARAYLPKRNAAYTLSIPEKNNYDIWILSQLLTSLSLTPVALQRDPSSSGFWCSSRLRREKKEILWDQCIDNGAQELKGIATSMWNNLFSKMIHGNEHGIVMIRRFKIASLVNLNIFEIFQLLSNSVRYFKLPFNVQFTLHKYFLNSGNCLCSYLIKVK